MLKHSSVLAGLAILASLLVLPSAIHGQALPSRVFDVNGGSVRMQGGLVGLKDEIILLMVLTNLTQRAVWAEVEIRPPGVQEYLQSIEKIGAGEARTYKWPVLTVTWDTSYPFTVSIFQDKRREKALGTQESSFFFEGDEDRTAFEANRSRLPPGLAASMTGFRELTTTSLDAQVTGTLASKILQRDITSRLFEEESRAFKECRHRVLKAEPYSESDRSIIAAGMGAKAQKFETRLRGQGLMILEKWFVQSCDAVNVYEVLLLASGNGTDIMVKQLDVSE